MALKRHDSYGLLRAWLAGKAEELGSHVNTDWAEEHEADYISFEEKINKLYGEGTLNAYEFNQLAQTAFYDYDGMKGEGETAVAILETAGADNIKGYCLVNNYGYTFNLNGVRCDARYWANCYGAALDEWRVDGRESNPETNAKLKEIETELNIYCY